MSKSHKDRMDSLAASYQARRDALGWKNAKGKMTKTGDAEALSWLVGVETGLNLMGESLGPVVWLSSIRGVEEFFGETRFNKEQVQ